MKTASSFLKAKMFITTFFLLFIISGNLFAQNSSIASIRGQATRIKDIIGPGGISSLGDNYPTSVENETTIPYKLAKDTRVDMAIYDLIGKQISVVVSWGDRDNKEVIEMANYDS